jgi:hypothetical protein
MRIVVQGLVEAPSSAMPQTPGQWAFHFVEGLLLAPVIESLIMVGIIETIRTFHRSKALQIIIAAATMGLLHSPSWAPRALIIAPAFAIWAGAYLYWKDISKKMLIGYTVIVLSHTLHSLLPAIADLGRAVRHGWL